MPVTKVLKKATMEEEYLSYYGRRDEQVGTEIRVPMSSLADLRKGMNTGRVTSVKASFVDDNGKKDDDVRLVYGAGFKLRMIRNGKSYPVANSEAECRCFIFRIREERFRGCCH